MCSSPHTILHVQSDNNETGGGLFEHKVLLPPRLWIITRLFLDPISFYNGGESQVY